MKHYGIIILAAGESKRLGQPKQLLEFKGKNLLQHVIDEAAEVDNCAVVVVLGPAHQDFLSANSNEHIIAGINSNPSAGMASSIQIGMHRLLQNYTSIKGCIIAVCDQPFIDASIFNALIDQSKTSGKGIVASAYADTLGTPVYLDKKYFDRLMLLSGNEGAKGILAENTDDIAQVPFQKGAIDIDLPADLEKLSLKP